MKPIAASFSHINLKNKSWTKPHTLDAILEEPAKEVKTYDELVRDVARLQYHNRQYNLFFRGQTKDHLDNDNKSTILASIFRKAPGEDKLFLKQRFETLDEKIEKLRKAFARRTPKFAGTHLLNKYEEVGWAILQHYQVCPTPVIDITHSLHVACSFAFEGNPGTTGIVYVLAMPWPTDAVSFNTYEELVNIRLLNICPPKARRPFFQEGYLLGNFPYYRLDEPSRVKQFDPARRVVAKFKVPITDIFWGDDFKRLPTDKIYPKIDEVRDVCETIKA